MWAELKPPRSEKEAEDGRLARLAWREDATAGEAQLSSKTQLSSGSRLR